VVDARKTRRSTHRRARRARLQIRPPRIRHGEKLGFQGFARRKVSAQLRDSRARSAARPCTRSCGFDASETIPFPGADSMFSSHCGAISGRLRVCRQPLSPRSRRPKRLGSRSTIGSGSPPTREPSRERPAREATRASRLPGVRRPMERPRAKSRFLCHFVSFQYFARRKISASVVTPIPSSARPAFGHPGNDDISQCCAPTFSRHSHT
jgi:hypothetical protein